MYKRLIRPILFKFSPEKAHNLTFSMLKAPMSSFFLKLLFQPNKENKYFEKNGFRVRNRIGLAAGLDKDAKVVRQLDNIGFGFIEVGTVTPLAQPGNSGLRLQRIIPEKAIINRMGFNNEGAENMRKNLKNYINRKSSTIGINLGKNKVTPLENAYKDYLKSFEVLYNYGDYFVINVSSPNTPNLRQLQDRNYLEKIFKELQDYNNVRQSKPLFVKIAPDLNNTQIDEIIELVKEFNLTGIIATNTTINRNVLNKESQEKIKNFENGGISGLPLKPSSTEIIHYIRQKAGEDIVIIGVGGIFDCKDAKEKIEAGADVVQIYTSFIYEGPGIVKRLKKCI